jgi:hypothetical protein
MTHLRMFFYRMYKKSLFCLLGSHIEIVFKNKPFVECIQPRELPKKGLDQSYTFVYVPRHKKILLLMTAHARLNVIFGLTMTGSRLRMNRSVEWRFERRHHSLLLE